MIDYDAHDWSSHLLDIRGSMVRQIVWRVLACALWSVAVVLIDRHLVKVGLPSTVHSLAGFAIGLLLVFRTNASYDRFWEGRRMWGAIINETRNIGRASSAWLRAAPELQAEVVRLTIGWTYAAMHSLRGTPAADSLAPILTRDEWNDVRYADHLPLALAARLSRTFQTARDRGVISDFLLGELDRNVQLLIDYLGSCERIHKTPLPFAYVVHLRRVLILYCYTVPIVLVDQFGWWAVPETFVLAYVFFGIEEIGVEIEDPFGEDENDLPLERFCETIERNLQSLEKTTVG